MLILVVKRIHGVWHEEPSEAVLDLAGSVGLPSRFTRSNLLVKTIKPMSLNNSQL